MKNRLVINIKDESTKDGKYFSVLVHEESPNGIDAGDVGFKGFDSKKEIYDFYNKYYGEAHNIIFKGDK